MIKCEIALAKARMFSTTGKLLDGGPSKEKSNKTSVNIEGGTGEAGVRCQVSGARVPSS